MAKEKSGTAVDEGTVREVDELVAGCDGLGVSRSEIVEAILTAVVQSETTHVEQVRATVVMCEDFYDTLETRYCGFSRSSTIRSTGSIRVDSNFSE